MMGTFKMRHARGFGFVSLDDGNEAYVPAHVLESCPDLLPRDRVSVEIRTQSDGRLRVTHIGKV